MGIPWDDIVVIQHAKNTNEPTIVTVNCPDKAGLGCDLCRIILEFGLRITRADISTDGRWCYIIFWVIPHPDSLKIDWESLKTRLLSPCPSCLFSYHFKQQSANPSPNQIYLLKVWIFDQKGLLYDINEILCNLQLTIQRVKVMPTPDGRALDLFFITDEMELFHTKKRRDDVCEYLMEALGEKCISSELQLAGPEYDGHLQGFSSLPPAYSEELFGPELPDKVWLHPLSQDMTTLKKPSVTVDNTLSPAHTLLQIQCVDQKGLCYDIMRISKDSDIKVAYGRFTSSVKGFQNIDLFVQQKEDGQKIIDPERHKTLCATLKEEMLHPLRVIIVNRGPDRELLVANPVELSGGGRPRVFYDVTLALKALGVFIFSAEVVRHSTQERQWEVYRFLLEESREFPLDSSKARSQIVDKVRRTLMGW
ncbi:ACT domain-containing protein ACR9-like [Vicia villosa]|uniref:ACT domain-containing protein ACR9-like n=1 Tax=Vicia villosa TaxID=3911 RepID=UPI00273C6840|nr:ACT domain-containing protein ACR9-like [Vicia villosa]XP_058753705.1 ACT domain-containing protein ACR9-like [Vicia villosa]